MKLKISVYTRLVLWITLLVCLLFGAVLVVIQGREAAILSEEAEARAHLLAESMRDANFQSLFRLDRDAVQSYAEGQIDDDMPFIAFYDKDGRPYAAAGAVPAPAGAEDGSSLQDYVSRGDPPYSRVRTIQVEGRRMRVREVEIPIFPKNEDEKWASVKIGMSLEPTFSKLRRVRAVLLLIGAGGFLLGIAGAAFLARRITRPIHKLVDGTVRISRGDFSQAITIASRDEIGDLARSFNEMTGQLLHAKQRMEEANRRLVQHEKLASIGRMAATIAHEIRNPLTSVKLNIQKVAEEEQVAEAVKAHLGLSLEGIGQIERFIKELLNFTRVQELNLERFPPEQIIEESLKVVRDILVQKRIAVEKAYAEGLPPLLVDGDKMRQVFLNIIRNSHEALESGGRITISCDAAEEGGRKMVRVRIADDGPGIPAKVRENIFEPFFSTKPSGFGLGLANARKIVEQHNGTIRVGAKRGRGCAFVILIPAEEAA